MKRIWILGLVLVVALASLGIAYGMWSVTLHITGTVTTGTLSAVLVPGTPAVTGDTKGVAKCTATVNTAADTLDIVFNDAFPGVICTVPFTVMNTGTIPIHLEIPALMTEAPTDQISIMLGSCYVEDEQVHAAMSSPVCNVVLEVLQNAASMGKTYTFSASFLAHQYNEDEDAPAR